MSAGLLLRCPACGLANGVTLLARMEDRRCAGCRGRLDRKRKVRYRADRDGRVEGPFTFSEVRARIASGGVRRNTLLSEEGGPWLPGEEWDDLFAGVRAPLTAAPHGRVRRSQPGIPGSVMTMAVLDFLVALLIGVGLMVVSDFERLEPRVIAIWSGIAAGHVALMIGLILGSPVARGFQLLLACLGILLGLFALRASGLGILVILIASIPFPLLSNTGAKAHFESQARITRRRGRPST